MEQKIIENQNIALEKLKAEREQIALDSMIRQMNVATDPWIEGVKSFFPSPTEGGTWITLENGKRVLITGLEFTDVSDYHVLVLGKNLDGSDATWLDYSFAGVGFLIPVVSGSAVKNGGKFIIDGTRKAIVKLGDDAVGTLNMDKIVLGKYPDYLNLADDLNAKRFNISKESWDNMTDVERWTANKQFLDDTISSGDEILLSNKVKDINEVTGTFKKELDYLIENGYEVSEDGLSMILK